MDTFFQCYESYNEAFKSARTFQISDPSRSIYIGSAILFDYVRHFALRIESDKEADQILNSIVLTFKDVDLNKLEEVSERFFFEFKNDKIYLHTITKYYTKETVDISDIQFNLSFP